MMRINRYASPPTKNKQVALPPLEGSPCPTSKTSPPPILKGGGRGVNSCLLCNYVEYIKSKPAENGKNSGRSTAKMILRMSVKGGNGYSI